MKKTYIIPAMWCAQLEAQRMIAQSLVQDSSAANQLNSQEILVKENRGSREIYNVWDDDWSK